VASDEDSTYYEVHEKRGKEEVDTGKSDSMSLFLDKLKEFEDRYSKALKYDFEENHKINIEEYL